MGIVRSLYFTGGKGLPVATRARPCVQAIMSSGLASLLEVGLESEKIVDVALRTKIRIDVFPFRGAPPNFPVKD